MNIGVSHAASFVPSYTSEANRLGYLLVANILCPGMICYKTKAVCPPSPLLITPLEIHLPHHGIFHLCIVFHLPIVSHISVNRNGGRTR